MKEHIADILVGGRPMTKLEKANKEIERLNNIIKKYEKMSFVHEIDLQNRIDKAIEYIRQLEFESEELYDISEFARLELLNILQGSDKE